LTKIAIISLTSRRDDGSAAILERELWETLMHNERISSKWLIEKISIIDDTELNEVREYAR
jgi:hypothetical protein